MPGVCTLYAGLYGVTCRIVHHTAPVLRTVSSTQRTQRAVGRTARECDVSAFLGVTTPSVTKLVNDMTSIGLLDKHADPSDRRAVTLTLTRGNSTCAEPTSEEYHAHLGDVLAETTAGPIPRPQPIRRASGRIRVPEIKERTQ